MIDKNELEHLQWALEEFKMVEVCYHTKRGTNRVMRCSRRLDAVPLEQHSGINDPRLNGPDIICVYDFDNSDWRSFRKDSISTYTLLD